MSGEQTEDSEQLLVAQIVDHAREEELGHGDLVSHRLHGDLALVEHVQVLIDELVSLQDGVPVVEILFFLVNLAIKNSVDLVHLGPKVVERLQLSQVITYLLTIATLGLSDVIEQLLLFGEEGVQLLLCLMFDVIEVGHLQVFTALRELTSDDL